MKITKQRLKEIIKEELSVMTERVATVPQVQQMAAAVGVRLSYGDAKDLAARTPADRNALVALQRALKDGSWKRMREELDFIGAEIEDVPEPPEPELSSPSPEAMTVTRPFLAMTREFSDYLEANEIPSEYDAIKQHLLNLGLSRSEAGIYALYGAQSGVGMEEGKVSGHRSEVTYATEKRGKSKKPEKKAYNKAVRAQAKRDLKK